jgi:DNA helicase-2/ATP-dependent DNA helicase PcrA
MEIRVDQLVPYGYIDVSISTFHAFGDRVLRDHAIDLGLRPDYRVLSLAEQLVFFREHLFEFPLKYYKSLSDPTRHLEALISAISRAQDENVLPEEYVKWAKKAKEPEQLEVAKVYKKYQELKEKKGFVDFGDQVGLTLKLFRKRPAILKKFKERYKYILVDEFQDTNYAQFELLKLLAGKKANLTVVGDDDQSIYKFRGAAISNILSFEKVYKKCEKIVLTKNYRSTQFILDTARRLIKHNDPERLEVKAGIGKSLKAVSKAPSKRVEHCHFDKVGSEADWVAQTINERGCKYSDFAILVRSNADAEPFRQSLNLLGIPHQFSGGGGLYLNPEVQLAISFLKSIGDLADSIALYQLASSAVYQLDTLDLQKMNTFARRRNYTLHHVFAHLEDGGEEFGVLSDVRTESRATVRKIMEDIKYYLDFAKQKTTGEVLYQFLKKSGYLSKLTKEQTPKNEDRLKNLAEFFEKVAEFKEVAEVDRVTEFVKHLNVLRESGDNPESISFDPDLDAVNVLTVHKAKGLEFRIVFLVSLVAEKFPARYRKEQIELPQELIKEKLPKGDFHLQEERRLFYVGMTRAKEELYLTSALDYGGKRKRRVSQFVLEALDMPRAEISAIKKSPREQIELFAPAETVIPVSKKLDKREMLSLSFYKIDDFLTCPLKYKYVHVLRVPLLPNHQIIYGAALHKAVQAYNLAKLNQHRFTQKDLVSVLLNNWSSEGFISREHEEQRLARAKEALKLFHAQQKKSKRKIKYVEEAFSVPGENLIIRGRWDRVDEKKRDAYIIDFKSSEVKSQKDADQRARNSLQLSIYALVWKERFAKLPHRVELHFLESGLVGSAEKDDKDIAKTWDKIIKVADGIRCSDFTPKPNSMACSYCAYNEICPASAV